MHDAAWIVLLQGEMAALERIMFIHEIRDDFVVHFDDDSISNRDDVLRPPRVISNELFENRFWCGLIISRCVAVKAPGFLRIRAGVLDLCLVTLRPAFAECRAKIHPAVSAVVQFHFRFEFQIRVSLGAEQMARGAGPFQNAVLQFPFTGIRRGPTAQSSSVKKVFP